ncbi:Uncharacterised protein [[Clostridium] sordellii]|uniref:Uncharacterized protein n=1 Tax=Paraclostridium sordellii TaxID=1505 RepID=A0A9P1KWH2_PARSO|nr:Uncharacterised protein [[Clostridium] sordellii] [Paeniclostridium sordellii]CEN21231.1 Uncharacterised protein [[Clostridium] sordellii] [Paeniclostridium sordellii]CEN31427.1 Uncharacterised protein [[Clostridium] sordellii] [Paeniclostridium sordellii]CEN31429.1 Uncharacterised protein [[Clostridium] sordellii] [Paeniclostridium sordellii]
MKKRKLNKSKLDFVTAVINFVRVLLQIALELLIK